MNEDFSVKRYDNMNLVKKQFRYIEETVGFCATIDDLNNELAKKEKALQYLIDLEDDLDDELFISRANGYATTKWGRDVIEDRIELYKSQIRQLKEWIATF